MLRAEHLLRQLGAAAVNAAEVVKTCPGRLHTHKLSMLTGTQPGGQRRL